MTGPVEAMLSRWRRRAPDLRAEARLLDHGPKRESLVLRAQERHACASELEDLLATVCDEMDHGIPPVEHAEVHLRTRGRG